MNKEQQAVLLLLRQSFWGNASFTADNVDWHAVDRIAAEQGVLTFVYDGITKCKTDISQEMLDKWRKNLFFTVVNNERLIAAQQELVSRFAQSEITMAILKGVSVSRYYPQPVLRALGDIDVLVDRKDVPKSVQLLEQLGYTVKENDHQFHIGCSRKDAYVELHFDVTELPESDGGTITRAYTDRFLECLDSEKIENHTFPILQEANQALMLILHMIRHTFDLGIGLRQLCDWVMFANSTDSNVFAEQILPLLKSCGVYQYTQVVTKLCVEHLGLSESRFSWCMDADEETCAQIIDGVFQSGNMGKANQEALSNLFSDQSLRGKKQSFVRGIVVWINQKAYKNFPITQRWKILLPLGWFGVVITYVVGAITGKGQKKSLRKVFALANKKKNLNDRLALFDIEQNKER